MVLNDIECSATMLTFILFSGSSAIYCTGSSAIYWTFWRFTRMFTKLHELQVLWKHLRDPFRNSRCFIFLWLYTILGLSLWSRGQLSCSNLTRCVLVSCLLNGVDLFKSQCHNKIDQLKLVSWNTTMDNFSPIHRITNTLHHQYTASPIHCIINTLHHQYAASPIHCIINTLHHQ